MKYQSHSPSVFGNWTEKSFSVTSHWDTMICFLNEMTFCCFDHEHHEGIHDSQVGIFSSEER